jgi:CHASE2 domain-containing sensor protein
MVAVSQNASNLGIDMLFILLWIGAWGTIETIIEWSLPTEKRRFMAYVLLFIIAFIAFLFVSHPEMPSK